MILAVTGLLLALTSFLIAALSLPALERRAHVTGLVDVPGGRKQHQGALPLTGGIAVLLAVAVPSLAGIFVALIADEVGIDLPPEISIHLPGIRLRAPQILAILLGAGAHLVLGHLDDRRSLSPWFRLGVEVAVAAGVAAMGVRITLFLESSLLHWLLTIAFIVFVTNAVNFIDNANGLMSGVVLISSTHLLALAVSTGQLFMAAVLACLSGGLLAFLPRNFPKARVIMGDAGSLPLGFLLASLSVAFTYTHSSENWRARLFPAAIPLLILAVPLLDGLVAVSGRLLRGVHPFTAGRDHLSHRLMNRGLSKERATVTLWLLGFAAGLPVLCMSPWEVSLAVWAIPAGLLTFLALDRKSRGPS